MTLSRRGFLGMGAVAAAGLLDSRAQAAESALSPAPKGGGPVAVMYAAEEDDERPYRNSYAVADAAGARYAPLTALFPSSERAELGAGLQVAWKQRAGGLRAATGGWTCVGRVDTLAG